MGAIAGFAIGYYLGTQDGREGFQRLQEAWNYISKSDDFQAMVANGTQLVGGMLRQSLSNIRVPVPGGDRLTSALTEGVVDLLSRRASAA